MSIAAEDIADVAIYPPLGLARVGNAPGEMDWFLASEVRGRPPEIGNGPVGPGRDDDGRILRQAVRFRIYARLKDGKNVELTLANVSSIEWSVTVANLKGGWYEFRQAMDLPAEYVSNAPRRNTAHSQNRADLDITPRTRTISGPDRKGQEYHFNDGVFFGKPVYLGELRTDAAGRLVFLGGTGSSAPQVPGTKPTTFANNNGWHDDVCDGPVRATIKVGDVEFTAEPGYVVVAPPNYAPGLFGVVTMEDAVKEAWLGAGWIEAPQETRFTEDIWPIFDRMSQMAWINEGIHVSLGEGSPLHARRSEVIDRLRDSSAPGQTFRTKVFKLFLPPQLGGFDSSRLPQIFGDGYDETQEQSSIERLSVTPTMYRHLERWRDGDFVDDWPGSIPALPDFDSLSGEQQIFHLERVALYECLGGPFHPGIEVTWSLRDMRQWKKPFRLMIHATDAPARQDFGVTLVRDACLADGGPLDGVAAGSLTRWMGVPWQTDEASCNSDGDYAPSLYLSMPSFWGPRVPDQILSSQGWSRVVDADSPLAQRRKHFNYREDWLRDIRGRDYQDRITMMVTRWWELGILVKHELADGNDIVSDPAVWVETGRPQRTAGTNEKLKLVARIENLDSEALEGGLQGPPQPYQAPRVRYHRGEV